VGGGRAYLTHRGGKGFVPARLVLNRLALRIARRQGTDQRLLYWTGAVDQRQRCLHGVISGAKRLSLSGRIIKMPGQVVVRAGRVRYAPLRHCALWVKLQCFTKALDGLRVVEAEHPVQPTIEPELRLSGLGRNLTRVRSEVVVGHR